MTRASELPAPAALDDLRARVVVGAPLGDLRGLPDRVVRAVTLAASTGAPAGPALAAASSALDDEREIARTAATATAQARAVTRSLAALPVLAVLGIGAVTATPLWRFYLTAGGRAVGLVGIVLVGAGVAASRALSARLLRPHDTGDEVLDLVATAVSAGLAPGAALRAVAAVLPTRASELGRAALVVELDPASPPPADLAPVVGVMRTAQRWGAPTAPALRHLASERRADERARVLAATQRLPALLTFPTVLFLLPASMLLTGAPVLASGLDAIAVGT